eukprot:jgi/Bigna1/88032/estExt_fgenesh1_pg.C_270109
MGLPAWVWDPYIIINLLVCLSYLYVRFHFDEDSMLFKNDMMGFTKEMQVGGSCLVALYVKYWKSNSLAEFFPTFFMYSKVAILICTAVQSKTICAWYAGEDKTPNKVVHLNTGNFGSVEDDRESTWLVQFYTTWANAAGFSSTFNALSNKYGSKRLKFGKVDIGRFRTLAKKFNISLSAVMNNELPTLILFEKVLARSIVVLMVSSVTLDHFDVLNKTTRATKLRINVCQSKERMENSKRTTLYSQRRT